MAMELKKYKYLIILMGAIFISYGGIVSGFFQQDEWFTFGSIIGGTLSVKKIFLDFFIPQIRHFNPLTDLLTILEFNVFKLNYNYWALASIFLHVVASILVFKLAENIFKKESLAFIASLLFALSAAPYQGTAWVVVNTATQGATIFGLLSLILFMNSRLTLSLVSLFISLFFKETTFATFLLLPLMFKLFPDVSLKRQRAYTLVIVALAVFYILIRALPFLSAPPSIAQPAKTSFYNFFTLPISSFVQSIVPVEVLVTSSERLGHFFPPILRGEKQLVVILSSVVFIIISATVSLIYKRLEGNALKRGLIFGYLFVILNSFIFLLSPERSGIMSIVDSRNLYYLSVGTSLITAALIGYFLRRKIVFGIFLLTGILTVNLFFLNSKIKSLAEAGQMRRGILEEIKSKNPDLPDKVVFYTESDTSYYGLPDTEKILPFQSGFGYTLLVWYYSGEDFPQGFFAKDFLWDIDSQGYREIGGRGFGYFRYPAKLPENINVITYSWRAKQ